MAVPAERSGSGTAALGLAVRARMGKSSASSRPCSPNGPTPAFTRTARSDSGATALAQPLLQATTRQPRPSASEFTAEQRVDQLPAMAGRARTRRRPRRSCGACRAARDPTSGGAACARSLRPRRAPVRTGRRGGRRGRGSAAAPPLVPGGFDEQRAGVAVAGLVDRPWRRCSPAATSAIVTCAGTRDLRNRSAPPHRRPEPAPAASATNQTAVPRRGTGNRAQLTALAIKHARDRRARMQIDPTPTTSLIPGPPVFAALPPR